MKEPKIGVPVTDLLHLIQERDAWIGSLPPDEHDEYLERFSKLKRKTLMAVAEYQRLTHEENPLRRARLHRLKDSRQWALLDEHTHRVLKTFSTQREGFQYANDDNIAIIP